MKTSELK